MKKTQVVWDPNAPNIPLEYGTPFVGCVLEQQLDAEGRVVAERVVGVVLKSGRC